MVIPKYPDFRPLRLEDKPLFDKAFELLQPRLSEYTFSNLYAWRNAYSFSVASCEGCILVRTGRYAQPHYLLPLGIDAHAQAQQVIERIVREEGNPFIRIPAETASLVDGSVSLEKNPDRDHADYLYMASDLIELKGRAYDGKRNHIKKFKAAHEYSYTELNEQNVPEWLRFEDEWCATKGCDTVESLTDEREAFGELVRNLSLFRLKGGALSLQNRIRSVALAERLNRQTVVMHILKADASVPGLYQTMMNEFLSREAREVTYVNLEQDLGVEGLRTTKLSYHPLALVEKWKISRKA